jgi:hypothetical protein
MENDMKPRLRHKSTATGAAIALALTAALPQVVAPPAAAAATPCPLWHADRAHLDWYAQDKGGNVWYMGEDGREVLESS